ncbi:MAG: U32 family peptidase [Lachnospiraceae bacterium]|nr:U32 family peptidase [Lachnospiraceae bacterium]
MNRKIELLAPAGSYESMRAAFNAGADAVYIGGRQFGARAYADNTTDDELLSAIDYAHLQGKQLYLTVNTLVKESELEGLYRWMKPLYEAGLDAAIVQDMGVFSLFRREFPLLDIHASTQMTVTGPDGAKLLKELGAVRVVPARELTVSELKALYDATGMEVEAFIHGALCYGYSGQCLLSSLIGGRSGNRGRCAQACRLPFTAYRDNDILNRRDESYLISLKDLCGLDMLPAMLDAGVYSLKIEGRMKSPQYTAGVASVYRKYVDRYLERGSEGYRVDETDRRVLIDLFDRGGTTDGYLRGKTGRQMLTLKEKPDRKIVNEVLFKRIEQDYLGDADPTAVSGSARLILGEPASLTVRHPNGTEVTVEGAMVEPAMRQPITADSAKKQLNKMGGSGYIWAGLEIITDEKGFLPVQELNRLRREGIQALTKSLLAGYRRELSDDEGRKKGAVEDSFSSICEKQTDKKAEKKESNLEGGSVPDLYVYLEDPGLLSPLLEQGKADGYYLALETFGNDSRVLTQAVSRIKHAGKKAFLAVPTVFQRRTRDFLLSLKQTIIEAEPDGLLVRTLDSLAFCKAQFAEILLIADVSLYTYNHLAEQMISQLGTVRRVLPVELNFRELESVITGKDEVIVYGRLPVMYSANCIRKSTGGCSHQPETLWLKDRKNKRFPVKNHCSVCFNTIYNSSPLHLLDCREEVMRLAPTGIRLLFTTEDEKTAMQLVQAYHAVYKLHQNIDYPMDDFTRGHYRRGIE